MTGDGVVGISGHQARDERARRQRLLDGHYQTLSSLYDANTFRLFERLGIAGGWHCWEGGAGGSTVPAWLVRRVGPGGRVLATDIDASLLGGAAGSGFGARRHDIAADPPPPGRFDLIHARLLLEHLAGRDAALTSLTQAVRPGGWLLIESADPYLQPLACPDETGPAHQLANRLRQACWTLQARHSDLGYGRTLPRRLRAAGLVDVAAEVFFPLAVPAAARLHRTMIERMRTPLLASAAATGDEIGRHLDDLDAGRLDVAAFPVVSVCGRKAT